jgi:hypothetical protein
MGIGGSKPLPGDSFRCKEKVPIEKEYGILKHKASGNCIYGDGDNIYYNNECDIKDKKAKFKAAFFSFTVATHDIYLTKSLSISKVIKKLII